MANVCPQEMLFYYDKGGRGKSARTLLRESCYEGAFFPVDPSVFQGEDEFRKQSDQFVSSVFKTVQEIRKDTHVSGFDLWKKCITNESVGVRPNYGRVHKMLKFGGGMWSWETNSAPQMIKCADTDDEFSIDHIARRVVVVNLRGNFVPDPTLTECLSQEKTILYTQSIFSRIST